jgi:hypothetical protein
MLLQPETASGSANSYADRIANNDERIRNLIGRTLIYASPVAAALCALALRRLVSSSAVAVVSEQAIVFVNCGVAVIGSATGVALLRGRLSVKIGGSLAYGVLSVLVYTALFAVFVMTRLWPA